MRLPWRRKAPKPKPRKSPHSDHEFNAPRGDTATLFTLYVMVDGKPVDFGRGRDTYAQDDKMVVEFTKWHVCGWMSTYDVFFAGHYLDSARVDVAAAGEGGSTMVCLPLTFTPNQTGAIAPEKKP